MNDRLRTLTKKNEFNFLLVTDFDVDKKIRNLKSSFACKQQIKQNKRFFTNCQTKSILFKLFLDVSLIDPCISNVKMLT